MSEDRSKAKAAQDFVNKCRALEEDHCQKFGFEKSSEITFITAMITDLDILALKYKENKEFINSVISIIKTVLNPPNLEIIDEPVYRELKKEYLAFFNKFPWFEDLGKHTIEFFEILSVIVITDNQENAYTALHVIHNLNKYFKNLYIQFSNYKKLLNFFIAMLQDFDNIINSTFFEGEYANTIEKKRDLIEKSLNASKPSKLSLKILNEFMELVIFLDQMYREAPEQKEFFTNFKDPFIFTLAKSYDLKWLKYSHQTKEFFSLKNLMIFLMFQYLHDHTSFQCENLFKSKQNIINMLIINIKHIPSSYWTIKRQFLKFFKEFLIKISKKSDETDPESRAAEDDVFNSFKDKILNPKFITRHSDNNIEIFKEFSYLIIEFSIRYLKIANKDYDKGVIEAILQLLRHPLSYPVEKIECAAEYFMRLTILSIQKSERTAENAVKERTFFHNELVEAICDASLERAEYLYNLSLKEEENGTFEGGKGEDDDEEIKKEDDMDVDDNDRPEPLLDMDYDFMSYTKLKELGKTKDVFERDDPFPLTMYSKKLRKRYFLRELNGACKRIVYKVPLYFLRSNSYLYLLKKSLDVMKKLLKSFFIMQHLCKKYQDIDLLVEKNNTLIVLIMLMCCKMPKNDLYETIRTYNNEIFNEMIQNLGFLKDILVPITDPKSKINEMILSCEPKRIDVKHINKEDLNIFHYTIIGSGLEYVLNHIKFIGKPPYKYHAISNLKVEEKLSDKDSIENVMENYPDLLYKLLEILNEAFINRKVEPTENAEYQSIIHLQSIIFNNLFKITINSFRLMKIAECNYVIYLKIIKSILSTYLRKQKKDIPKFKPLLLVIIEHVIHMRKEMGKRKELNDIMLNLPLGIKHLIEYMPFIFDFIQESLHNKDDKDAIDTFTHWIRVLSSLNEIIDPIISPSFPEFTADLFEAFHANYMKKDSFVRNGSREATDSSQNNNYGTIFWLISKLGPKCRIYNDDKIFRTKEDTVNGMKIMFLEKNFDSSKAKSQNTFISFSIPLISLNEHPYKYQECVEQIMEFMMPCMLFCINPNSIDSDLVKKCIKNVLVSESNADIFDNLNKPRVYPFAELYDEDPKISRSRQIRSFELIIRMLFASCLIPSEKFEKIYDDIIPKIKGLTCHFVLLYICKNGRLINKIDDDFCEEEKALLAAEEIEVGSNSFLKNTLCEINPLIFLDIVCEFLYEGYQNNHQVKSKSFSTASKIVLNEIFRLLRVFYPDEKDYTTALERLEFVDLLFKKICNLSYSEGIQKKIGCISAIKILIEHCPVQFLKRYNIKIIESQIVIIKNMLLSYGGLPSKLISNLLLALAKKNDYFFEDKEEMRAIVLKVFEHLKDVSCKGRRILEGFLDTIRKAYKSKLTPPPRRTKRKIQPPQNPFPEIYNDQLKALCKSILSQKPIPKKIDYLLEGYTQIENLINETDVVLHLFKHKCESDIDPEKFFSFVDQLVEVLEYEIEIFNDTLISDKCCFATKFYLVEKLHIDNNKIHDLYSSTKYLHRLFNLSFEKPRTKRKWKSKGSEIPWNQDYIKSYYAAYLEKSLGIQMEIHYDYDSYLNELFPNHDQHIEYMILILCLLSEFCSNESIQEKLKNFNIEEEAQRKMTEKLAIYKKRIIILMMC